MKKRFINFNLMAAFVAVVGLLSSCSTQNEEPTPNPDPTPGEQNPILDGEPDDEPTITEIPARYYEDKLAPMPLPSSLKHIEEYAFCNSKNEFLVIPEGVETIGRNAFVKGKAVRAGDFDEFCYYDHDEIGKLEWVYLPSTLKTIGKEACFGILIHEYGGTWHTPIEIDYYEQNPKIIMTSPIPPEGFVSAYHNGELECLTFSKEPTYVPEKYLEKYEEARYYGVGEILKERGTIAPPGDDIIFEEYQWRIEKYAKSFIPLYTYKPIDIEITKEGGTAMTFTYSPTSANEGEITEVEWDTSDHSIAEISSEGVLTPIAEGKTYVQCIAYTKASNGDRIKFYFFKPIKVTLKGQNGNRNLILG